MTTSIRKPSTSPAFQFYPKDFLTSSKVLAMSIAEVGAYIKLLCLCWLDGSIPAQMPALSKLVGVSVKTMTAMWPALDGCFILRADGRLINRRLDRERQKQADFRKQQKERAAKRWDKSGNADPAMPPHASGTAGIGNALQSPISDLQSPISKTTETRARAPIIDQREHRNHAQCGRVCLHASLFGEFVRRRNHDGADREVRDWALVIEQQWSVGGEHERDEPGDPFDFWRARYDEQWPTQVKLNARVPEWAR